MSEQRAAQIRAKGSANVWIDGDTLRIRFSTPGENPYNFEFGFDPNDSLWLGNLIIERSKELLESQLRAKLMGGTDG